MHQFVQGQPEGLSVCLINQLPLAHGSSLAVQPINFLHGPPGSVACLPVVILYCLGHEQHMIDSTWQAL